MSATATAKPKAREGLDALGAELAAWKHFATMYAGHKQECDTLVTGMRCSCGYDDSLRVLRDGMYK